MAEATPEQRAKWAKNKASQRAANKLQGLGLTFSMDRLSEEEKRMLDGTKLIIYSMRAGK